MIEKANKNKIIAIVLSIIVIIGVVVGLLIWLLGKKPNNPDVDVEYVVTEVYGTASASYFTKNKKTPIAMKTKDNKNKLEFNGVDDRKTYTLSPTNDIILTSDERYIVFKYAFTNTGEKNYNATITYKDTDKKDTNVKVEYALRTTDIELADADYTLAMGELNQTSMVAANNGTMFCYIKVSILDSAKNAIFSGAFNWMLSVVE